MAKKVRVALHGRQNRSIMLDADATKGATLGKDLRDEDGNIITLESIVTNVTNVITNVTDPRTVFPTLWELILNIPDIIKSLAALTKDGWMRNNAGVISAQEVAYTKNSVEVGESATIPEGHQALVWEEFTFDGGDLLIDGDLIILGSENPQSYIGTGSSYVLTKGNWMVEATAAGLTFTLPTAVNLSGHEFVLKNYTSGALTIDGNGSETIDDGLTAILAIANESITIVSDGANWSII